MGFIRGFFLVIAAVLLFLSLLSMTLFWTLSSSLSYDNVQRQSTIIIENVLEDNLNVITHMQKISPTIQLYCQNYSDDYVFSFGGYVLGIPCSVSFGGAEAIIGGGVKSLVHEVYYREYECNFLDCMKQMNFAGGVTPLFLISEKVYTYMNNKFYISLMVSFILLALIFLLIQKKTNLPILVGILLIISSLLFIKLDYILSLFSDKTLFKLLGIFFSESYFISLKILIAGIILVIIGVILKIFKIGFFISNLISKIKKQPKIVREKQKPAFAEKKQKQQKIQPAKKGAKKTQKFKSK